MKKTKSGEIIMIMPAIAFPEFSGYCIAAKRAAKGAE